MHSVLCAREVHSLELTQLRIIPAIEHADLGIRMSETEADQFSDWYSTTVHGERTLSIWRAKKKGRAKEGPQ